MKKTISLVLIVTLLFGFSALHIFAQTETTDSDVCPANHLEKNNDPSAFEDSCLLNTSAEQLPQTITTPSLDDLSAHYQRQASNYSFQFKESSQSFIQKITSSNFNIEGSVIHSDNSVIELTEYISQTNATRFDIVDIACQNEIISDNQRIETYCTLIQNRQFENVMCLHGVVKELLYHMQSDSTMPDTKSQISLLFSSNGLELPTDPSEEDLLTSQSDTSNEDEELASYSSTNFTVFYEEGIALSEVIKVANYLESVRIQYLSNLGFRAPLLNENETKYKVTLRSGISSEETEGDVTVDVDSSSSSSIGICFPSVLTGTTRPTSMVIFYFSSLNDETKETLAHEYFHAIEAAYLYSEWIESDWFEEASAVWAALNATNLCTNNVNIYVSDFIRSLEPMNSHDYGSVLFLLTIQRECGNNTIKALWEAYDQTEKIHITRTELKELVFDEVLSNYSESFDSIFLKMSCYCFSPSTWYSSVVPGGTETTNNWSLPSFHLIPSVSRPRETTLQPIFGSRTIMPLGREYFKFLSESNTEDGDLTIEVTFTGYYASNSRCSVYYVTSDGQTYLETLPTSDTNTYTINKTDFGNTVSWFGIVISNTSVDATVHCTIKYKFERGTSTIVSIPSNSRYYEDVAGLGKGDYKDYFVTFSVGGEKTIQTFGTKDSYLELFDSSGNRILYNDDGGYSTNALIAYNFSANTQYRIRLTFYSTTTTGNVKLAITSNTSPQNYEGFTTYTNPTATITGNFTRYKVNPFVIKFTTQQTITMNLLSEANTYLYIIDPRSTELVVAASNSDPTSTQGIPSLYNDNYFGGENPSNSQIIKTFTAGVPYLIIASKYMTAAAGSESFSITLS